MAIRLSSGIYLDQGVAVAACIEQPELEPERASPVTLCHYPGVGRKYRRQCRRQLPSEGARVAVWRVEEDQIVFTTVAKCGLEEPRRRLGRHLGLDPQRLQITADRGHRGVRRVHQRSLRSAPGERLDAERARPREQVKDAQAADIAQDGEQRLADAV